jgi:hypothetical protein
MKAIEGDAFEGLRCVEVVIGTRPTVGLVPVHRSSVGRDLILC